MKTTIGVTILGAALCAAPAATQERRQGPEGRGRSGGVQEYLGLSEQQQEQWRALERRHREDMKPLREEGRVLRQKLRESLEANEPELLVGEAAKAAYAHEEKVEASRKAFEARLASVLTPEQQEKFEAFKAARRSGRAGRQQGPREPRRHPPASEIDG